MGKYVNETMSRSWDGHEEKELYFLIHNDGSGEIRTDKITIALSGTYDVMMLQKALHRANKKGLARYFRRDGRPLSVWKDDEGGLHIQGVLDYNVYLATEADTKKFESILEKHIN